MKRKAKHLDVITNPNDSLGSHPNLVIEDDNELKGYTITHMKNHPQYQRMKTVKEDYTFRSKDFVIKNTHLTVHSNKLDKDKEYTIKAIASENLISKFINYLITLIK